MNTDLLFACTGEPLPSRRNDVRLVRHGGDLAVLKRYRQPGAAEREARTLQALLERGVPVPRLLAHREDALLLEYVPGEHFERFLSRFESGAVAPDACDVAADALCRWMLRYAAATNALRGDVNLKNFLLTPAGECVGVDFEEPLLPGDPATDVGRLLAFAATYRPSLTPGKQRFCRRIAVQFLAAGMPPDALHAAYTAEIAAILTRRDNCDFNETDADAFFSLLLPPNIGNEMNTF